MFGLGPKSLSQANFAASPFGNSNIDQSSLDPSQSTYQPSHHMSNITGQQQHHRQQQQQPPPPNFPGHAGFIADSPLRSQTQTMNNADINAANSLFLFTNKAATSAHNFSPMANGPQLAGSWGNLSVAQNSNMPLDRGGYASATSPAQTATPFNPNASDHARRWSGSRNGDRSHVHDSQHITSEAGSQLPLNLNPFQTAPPHTATQQRAPLPGVNFGTDPNFNNTNNNSTHFESGIHWSKEKANNLLNVPMADTLRSPYGPAAKANQHTENYSGGPWSGSGSFSRPRDEDEPAPKRHKGQGGRDNQQGWDASVKVEQNEEESSMQAPPATNFTSQSSGGKRPRPINAQPPQQSNSSPATGDDGGEVAPGKRGTKKRDNLTEEQKRKNHIHSEQKRRLIIQQGYADLNKLVPCLASGKSGLSRSECLQEIGSYLETLSTGNMKLMDMLKDVDENHPALLAVHKEWADATARIE